MPNYTDFIQFLESLPQAQINRLARRMRSGEVAELANAFPAFTPCLTTHSFECIAAGVSKVFKVTKLEPGETPFILKIFPKSRIASDTGMRLKEDPEFNHFIVPLHWRKECNPDDTHSNVKYEDAAMEIQLQDFCWAGTLESYSQKPQTPEARINNALECYLNVARFYLALEKKNICFFDGKPSNFILLNHKGDIAIADTKNFAMATAENFDNNSILHHDTYPLRLPWSLEPFTLRNIHACHFALGLYLFLMGLPLAKMVNKPLVFTYSAPIFTDTENGKALAYLLGHNLSYIKNMCLSVEEFAEGLKALQWLTQLETLQKRSGCTFLEAYLTQKRSTFEDNFEHKEQFIAYLLELKFVLTHITLIQKIQTLAKDHFASKPQTLLNFQKDFNQCLKNRNIVSLGTILSKLEYRIQNAVTIDIITTLLRALNSFQGHNPETMYLRKFIFRTQAEFKQKVNERASLEKIQSTLESRIRLEEDVAVRRRSPRFQQQPEATISLAYNPLSTFGVNAKPRKKHKNGNSEEHPSSLTLGS